MLQPVLVIAGATASGKSALAVELAKTFDAEIVGADSRQIYAGMPIGTAMPTPAQRGEIPHHLIDFLDPRERYSAARYASDAIAAIEGIQRRGKRAIVVGGTGFYIRALLGGVEFAPQYDEALRDRLAAEARTHPPEFLHGWLETHDARRAAELYPQDTYRVLRALEVVLSAACYERRRREALDALLVFLDVPLDEIDRRIDARTDRMLSEGFVGEAERVGADAAAASAVGYPHALAFLRGWSTRAELRASLARATRRYARRQRTWFRGEPGAVWLRPEVVAEAAREKLGWLPKAE